jgi:hypothetical protein
MDAYRAKILTALQTLRERFSREDGQGGVEYFGVVIAGALIVVAIVTLATTLGPQMVEEIQSRVDAISEAGGGCNIPIIC